MFFDVKNINDNVVYVICPAEINEMAEIVFYLSRRNKGNGGNYMFLLLAGERDLVDLVNLLDLLDLTSSTLLHLGKAQTSLALRSTSEASCRVSGKEVFNVNYSELISLIIVNYFTHKNLRKLTNKIYGNLRED